MQSLTLFITQRFSAQTDVVLALVQALRLLSGPWPGLPPTLWPPPQMPRTFLHEAAFFFFPSQAHMACGDLNS